MTTYVWAISQYAVLTSHAAISLCVLRKFIKINPFTQPSAVNNCTMYFPIWHSKWRITRQFASPSEQPLYNVFHNGR